MSSVGQHIVVREFARLTVEPVIPTDRGDVAQVTSSAFDWLCQESARIGGSAALIQMESRRWLRLDNYVGVIQTPCGTTLEILPKVHDAKADIPASRRLLQKMLSTCLELPVRDSQRASIQAFDAPLNEWVMRQFLDALETLVKRGLRFDYHRVQSRERFLKGRLDLARQSRQQPGAANQFCIEHDIFDSDRPENRLVKAALDLVVNSCVHPDNWRLSRELSELLVDVPRSIDVRQDFRRWGRTRLLAHYQSIRPWCQLILGGETPISTAGSWDGMSLLFPMEKVFERYVGACLRRQLPAAVELRRTARDKSLCDHRGAPWFNLQPDLMLERAGRRLTMDTKWKLLDRNRDDAASKYGLSQSDFYQLFAYGHKYQSGRGDLLLIYPSTQRFETALPEFRMMDDMRLWVVPFCLWQERLIGLDLLELLDDQIAA